MGWVARVLSFARVADRNGAKVSDVQIDTGGGPNLTVEHFASPGDDSYPLDTDYATGHAVQQTGREAVVGYVDPKNTPKALKGDKRIYARDSSTGATVVEVWLKNDGEALTSNDNGSIKLRPDGGAITTTPNGTFDAKADGSFKGVNGNGSFELQANGDFLVNGVKIDTNGNITTPGTLNADDVTADNQDVTLSTHTTASFGTPPTPGT